MFGFDRLRIRATDQKDGLNSSESDKKWVSLRRFA